MEEIVQQLKLSVLDVPTVPETGVLGNNLVLIIALIIFALAITIVIVTLILLRVRSTNQYLILPLLIFTTLTISLAGITTTIANASPMLSHTDTIELNIIKPDIKANVTVNLAELYTELGQDPDSITIKNKTGDFSIETLYKNDTKTLAVTTTLGSTIQPGNYTAEIVYSFPVRIIYMQDLTSDTCNALTTWNGTTGDILVLKDKRNEKPYNIAKLADGNCWMLNNLMLGSEDGTTELTPAMTNIASNWLLPQVDGSNSMDYDVPHAYGPVPGHVDDINSEQFYGYLYNWCAATGGGTASGGSDTCTDSWTLSEDATGDICPAGWRLPAGGYYDAAGNEFANLVATATGYPSNIDTGFIGAFDWGPTFTANIQPTGVFRGNYSGSWYGNFWDQGGYGSWWSGSAYSNAAFNLGVSTWDYVTPDYASGREVGYAIRCLLQK